MSNDKSYPFYQARISELKDAMREMLATVDIDSSNSDEIVLFRRPTANKLRTIMKKVGVKE